MAIRKVQVLLTDEMGPEQRACSVWLKPEQKLSLLKVWMDLAWEKIQLIRKRMAMKSGPRTEVLLICTV